MSSPNRNIFQKKCCDQILAAFGKIARPTPAHEISMRSGRLRVVLAFLAALKSDSRSSRTGKEKKSRDDSRLSRLDSLRHVSRAHS
jgi:hypothetical protein